MTTLATMRSRVKIAMGNKQGFDDQIDLNLNEATLQHTLAVKPKEMQGSTTFSTSNATFTYDIGDDLSLTDLYAFLYVRNNTDDLPLTKGDETDFNNSKQDTSESSNLGRPNKWIHIADDIILYSQIPDSTSRTISVRYLKRPPTMTSSQDFPLEEEHERPVEQLAKGLTWLDLGNEAKAQAAFASYQALVDARNSPDADEDLQSMYQLIPIDGTFEAD